MTPLFRLQGIVQKGDGRGRKLGFPTINFPLTQSVSEGIYASQTKVHDKMYNSITFIGPAATYHQTEVKAETYILNFSDEIYGETVSIDLLKMLRDNKHFYFESEEDLVKQMNEDQKMAEEFFKTANR